MMCKLKQIFFLFLFLSIQLSAQQTLLPLNTESQHRYEKALLKKEIIFTAQRPFLFSDINSVVNVDSIRYRWQRDTAILAKLKHPLWWRKLRVEDLVKINNKGFVLKINPLLNFSSGRTLVDTALMINTRGVDIYGDLGKYFSFGAGLYENQAYFPDYYTNTVKKTHVVPGQGRARTFKDKGYDYGHSYGYVSFTPNRHFNFQIGHGKHFIGEGYRSLIYSDNAFNMPYAKWTTTWKRVRYTNLLLAYQDVGGADGMSETYNRRYGSVTSIDFLIGQFMEIGLSESIVWQKKKEFAYFPDANYYNPIILFRTLQYGMNHKNNVLLGINSKIKLTQSILTYFQLVYDDTKKTAYQIGVKYYDVFKLPLFLQLEYNSVKPYTYSHWDKQSYTHYNQALSHPLGANFSEFVAVLRFSWKDVIVSYQVNYAQIGKDTSNLNFGSNIFIETRETQGNTLYQGLKTNIVNHGVKLAYLINPSSDLQLYFEYRIRSLVNDKETQQERFYLFGIKTNLINRYSDF